MEEGLSKSVRLCQMTKDPRAVSALVTEWLVPCLVTTFFQELTARDRALSQDFAQTALEVAIGTSINQLPEASLKEAARVSGDQEQ